MFKKHLASILAVAAIALAAVPASAAIGDGALPERPKPVAAHVFSQVVAPQADRVSELLADTATTKAVPLVALRAADQYEMRHLQRQRPEVTPDWRLCPSV